MRTNRPAAHRATRPTTQIAAVAAVLALIVTSAVIALAAFAAGSYPHRDAEEPAATPTSASAETPQPAAPGADRRQGAVSGALLDPSVGRGADSRACAVSPRSPRCRLEGGGGMSATRGGHALRPATDGPDTLLKSERAERGPADMPGRAPGRGGWVGEEGPSRA